MTAVFEEIPVLHDMKSLDGKIVKLVVRESEGVSILAAVEKTGVVTVLIEETKK